MKIVLMALTLAQSLKPPHQLPVMKWTSYDAFIRHHLFFLKFWHCFTSSMRCSCTLQTILYLFLSSKCWQSSQIISSHHFIAKSIMLNASPSFLGAGPPIPKADLANSLFILFETSSNIILYAVHCGSTALGVLYATMAL